MENVHRLAHILIIILVTIIVTVAFTPSTTSLAQSVPPSSISELAAARMYDNERIQAMEKQIISLREQVDDVRRDSASVKSAGATIGIVIGALSILGLLAKRKA